MALTKPSDKMLAPGSSLTLGTEQASTSGAAINFTDIPAGTKQIIVMIAGVSPSSTGGGLSLQIGDAGGLETSGYTGIYSYYSAASHGVTALGNQFQVSGPDAATDTYNGTFTLTRLNGTHTWVCTATIALSAAAPYMYTCAGTKTLTAELDRVSVLWSNGMNFDAGSINIAYK